MGEQTKQSTGSGGPDRLASVKTRVDELGSLNRQLQEARITGRRVRFMIGVVILVVFVGYGVVIFNMIRDLTKNKSSELMAQMKTQLLDTKTGVARDFIDMIGRVAPVYQAELQKEFRTEWPNIRKNLEDESKKFLDTIQGQIENRTKERLAKMAKRQEAKVWAAFPELKDAKARDIVMTNLEKALQEAVVDVFEQRIEKAKDRLAEVHDRIMKFVPEENREGFQERMSQVWERVLLQDLGGLKHIDK